MEKKTAIVSSKIFLRELLPDAGTLSLWGNFLWHSGGCVVNVPKILQKSISTRIVPLQNITWLHMVYQQHKIPWRLWYISHDISEVFICRCVNSYCFGMTKISPCFVLQLTWKICHGFFSSRCLRYLGVYLFTHSEKCSLFWMLFCWTSALITNIIPLLYTFYELSFILQKWPVLYLVHYLWGEKCIYLSFLSSHRSRHSTEAV